MTIQNITINTAGFALINVIPSLPYGLPPSSNARIQLDIRSPNFNFYGPLTITITYH